VCLWPNVEPQRIPKGGGKHQKGEFARHLLNIGEFFQAKVARNKVGDLKKGKFAREPKSRILVGPKKAPLQNFEHPKGKKGIKFCLRNVTPMEKAFIGPALFGKIGME